MIHNPLDKLCRFVTTVQAGESIHLDDGYVVIKFERVRAGRIRVSVTAPRGVKVKREENV